MAKKNGPFHQRIILGIELEGYTISTPDHTISRKLAFHRKGTAEKGEKFRRDWSIGTEYNSRPFSTIREGLFLLKTGLRKYNHSLYRRKSRNKKCRQIFLVGGWKDRFAGAHIHLSVANRKLTFDQARKLAAHIHDHIPLLIAISANSPVWQDKITQIASNRVLKGSKTYFQPIHRGHLSHKQFDEITLNRATKTKPPTLECRVMDSNIPEIIMICACIIKACALGYLRGKKISNKISHFRFLKSRVDAAKNGMDAKLSWNHDWLSAAKYLDRFVWTYRQEFREMDIPQEIWAAMKLLKRGLNGSEIIRHCAEKAYRKHPQTWKKRLAKKYIQAINTLLEGNSSKDFVHQMGITIPNISRVWLGRKKLKLL
ncbi:MAG: hypothetical protein JW893_03010 [Candidatus Omnitrophica bacterium]|nr:hypothetical protein [Candidatus Omnitrophota bacterium]